MRFERTLKINFKEIISDEFDDDMSFKDSYALIEQHIQDWCIEHNIAREFVEVVE